MRVKCDYCRSYISDTDEFCPYCQAPNSKLMRKAHNTPETIEELKNWYTGHNLPSEKITRFFIGKNIKEPKAFGIYYDENSENFIVYKNKSDGSRSIRYEGKDEPYAVNELYMKLKDEIANQKSHQTHRPIYSKKRKRGCFSGCLAPFLFFLGFVIFSFIVSLLFIDKGYYIYKNNIYYLNDTCSTITKKCNFYKYDENQDEWNKTDYPKGITNYNKAPYGWEDTKKVITMIDYNTGYYYYDNNAYYLYSSCKVFEKNNCEIYKYNKDLDSWSIVELPNDIKGSNYVGTQWANAYYSEYKPYIDSIVIKTQYYQEEWFRKLHPKTPYEGYYNYNNSTYYYYKNNWYIYSNGWSLANGITDDFSINHEDYYESSYNYNIDEPFTDSSYYEKSSSSSYSSSDYDSSSYDDDWDSGSSWDSSDSWDSGSTDWDSDW